MDARTFYELSVMPEEEKCRLIDSGAFNEIISGYVLLAKETADKLSEPIERTLWRVFDDYSAEDALTKLREY